MHSSNVAVSKMNGDHHCIALISYGTSKYLVKVLTYPYSSKKHLYLPPKHSQVQGMHTPLLVQGGLSLTKEPSKGRCPKHTRTERLQPLLPKDGRGKALCQVEKGQQGAPAAVHVPRHCPSPLSQYTLATSPLISCATHYS